MESTCNSGLDKTLPTRLKHLVRKIKKCDKTIIILCKIKTPNSYFFYFIKIYTKRADRIKTDAYEGNIGQQSFFLTDQQN